MKISHIFFLVFRYITLICAGLTIAFLWKNGGLEQHEYWGRFYALWFPLMFAMFSTGYVVAIQCLFALRNSYTAEQDQLFEQFRTYDDFTYVLLVVLGVLEIIAPYIQHVRLWIAVFYLLLIVIKASIFITYLYHAITGLPDGKTVPFPAQCLLVLVALMIYVSISAYHIQRTSLTGDEPHYLLITHSLWHDHDRNLYNNYKNRDYEAFFPYELAPTWGDQVSETEIYSYRHSGGFAHTLLPGYVLGGQLGVVLQTNLITAVLMLQVFLLSYELFHTPTASFLTWVCCAFSLPMIVYMGQLYPETLATLLTMWGIRRILKFASEREPLSQKQFWRNCGYILAAIICIVALKTRYLPLAATLGAVWFFYLVRRWLHIKHVFRLVVGIVLMLAAGGLIIVVVDRYVFAGAFWERLRDWRYMSWILSGYNPISGFFGLLVDQEYGLLPYAPIYGGALLGIGVLTWEEFKKTWPLLGILAVNYLVICCWPLWHAAPTPASRYILPILPILGVFFARFFMQPGGMVKTLILGVSGIWSFLMAWFVTLTPKWRYNWADGTSDFLETASLYLSVLLTKIVPSWIRPTPFTPYVTGCVVASIMLLVFVCRRAARASSASSSLELFGGRIILVTAVFLGLSGGILVVAKKLPMTVLEAEDTLDMRRHGGERVPATPDPWRNQNYLRTWQYQGWKLFSGDFLEIRPIIPLGKVKLETYARVEEQDSSAAPLLLVLIDGQEIWRTPVAATGWKIYTSPLIVKEARPHIEIRCEGKSEPSRGVIIDKVRFQIQE